MCVHFLFSNMMCSILLKQLQMILMAEDRSSLNSSENKMQINQLQKFMLKMFYLSYGIMRGHHNTRESENSLSRSKHMVFCQWLWVTIIWDKNLIRLLCSSALNNYKLIDNNYYISYYTRSNNIKCTEQFMLAIYQLLYLCIHMV